MVLPLTRWGDRLRQWPPATPDLPEDLADLLRPDDPDWFAREMAIAAAPPWWFWRSLLRNFSWLVGIFGRVEVTGGVPEELRRGPLLLAANHIGDFDPFVVAVALHRVGITPRIMATGGIVSAPVAGPLLERTGAIRVERGTELARHAVRITEVALVSGGHVVAFPEGRVRLAADAWPERGRTGMARLALGLGVPVIPVSQWGAHEVLQYANDLGRLRTAPARRRPPSGAAGARRTTGAPRRPAHGPGRRRQPRPLPHRRRDHPRAGAATRRRGGAPALRRPDPPHHRRGRLPRRRRPRGHPVTSTCWIAAERPERVRR